MDLQYFFNILWRRKWLILVVMTIATIATYFFVDRKADTFKSNGLMTTSIVGQRGVNPLEEKPWIMEYYVNMGFENMIEAITSPRTIDFLTARLLLHDLGADTLSMGNEPFRRLAEMEDVELNYSPDEIENLIDTLQYKVDNLQYEFSDPEQYQIFNDVATALSYDYENLLKYNLGINRSGDTDNLLVEFESENPKLSTWAINTFMKDYLRLYKDNAQEEVDITVKSLKTEKENAEKKMLALEAKMNSYKNQKSLYDAADESQGIISRRNKINENLQLERSRVPTLRANIRQLERLLNEKKGETNEIERSSIYNSEAVLNMKRTINELDEKIIKSGGTDEEAKKLKELTQKNLDDKIKKLADLEKEKEDIPDNKQSQANLFDQKVQATLDLNEANQRILTLEADLETITNKQTNLVQDDAVVRNMESEFNIARKTYEDLEVQYGKATRKSRDTYQPLKILEYAKMPKKPVSKKKMLLSAFAGIVGGVLSTVLIFLMAFFDTSVNSISKFRKFTKVDLLGTINKVDTDKLDLKYLFSSNGQNKTLDTFKESLRNIRYLIETSNSNRFLFTSTRKQEGKTFLIMTLAHALTIKDKKILIVDTNFKNNTLTKMSKQTIEENLLNSKLLGENDLSAEFVSNQIHDPFNLENVDIIGNKGSYQSPSEVFAGKDFDKFLEGLEEHYDYIFFESASMNNYSDTKELTKYVDKVIAVFGAENDIKNNDKESIDYLNNLGSKFMGAILNKMDLRNLS